MSRSAPYDAMAESVRVLYERNRQRGHAAWCGARGLVIETMKTLGADSFGGRLACVIQGSTETTFYVLAVYFGSVGIKNTRHAIACGLTAEFAGFLGAVGVSYLFFG